MKIQSGYKAFNGHIFSEREAEIYNEACERAEKPNADEHDLNSRFITFFFLIGLNKTNNQINKYENDQSTIKGILPSH